MTKPSMLWCDVETLGLDEKTLPLLEVGLAATNQDLEVIAEISLVIGHPDIRDHATEERVREMHERSGLLAEVEKSEWNLSSAEASLIAWVDTHAARGLCMAGSGVWFDRRWLSFHMPKLSQVWHYHNYDISTLRRFWSTAKPEPAHRTLGDIHQAIGELRKFEQLKAGRGTNYIEVTLDKDLGQKDNHEREDDRA